MQDDRAANSFYNTKRSHFFAVCLVLFGLSLVLTIGCAATDELYSPAIAPPDTPFKMPEINPPTFPERTFDIRDYGAIGDGITMNTGAIASAIAACAGAGGGRVQVPAGIWLTGPIHLKSNVNLHIDKGAEVSFSTRFEDYLPVVFTRWEGTECYNYSPLIYARDCSNVAITGGGTLDGQGEVWWYWSELQRPAARKLYEAACKGVPVKERVFGTETDALRPQMIQLVNCKNVLLKDYTSRNSPFWTNHLVYCENVIVRNLKLLNPERGPNTDGINIDSCRDVCIDGVYADVGDDAICIKAGLNEDGWRIGRPTENVVVRNCQVRKAHGGFVIGSEMSGGVRNVLVQDCRYEGTEIGIRIKSMRGRGGVVENIWIRDIAMGRIKDDAIRINMFYQSSTVKPLTDTPPQFHSIHIENVTCNEADTAVVIKGLPEKSIKDITLENVTVSAEEGVKVSDGENICLTDVNVTPKRGPVIQLSDSKDVTIRHSDCPVGADIFLRLDGEKTENILLSGNDLSKAKKDIVFGEGVQHNVLIRD